MYFSLFLLVNNVIMLQSGIYTAPSQFEAMFVSYAHSDEDIAKTIDAIKAFIR